MRFGIALGTTFIIKDAILFCILKQNRMVDLYFVQCFFPEVTVSKYQYL